MRKWVHVFAAGKGVISKLAMDSIVHKAAKNTHIGGPTVGRGNKCVCVCESDISGAFHLIVINFFF